MNNLEKKLLNSLLKIRLVEKEISKRYSEEQIRCPVHLSLGQEAAAVGVCSAISKEDYVFSTHRCHSHYLAKGGNLKAMVSELYGKKSGCCGGRGGSMHLMDTSVRMMMSVPIVASVIPIAVGAALSLRLKKKSNIIVVFFGDAAVEEGVFHESANFASLTNIPVLFVCENNQYSCFTNINDRQPSNDLTRLAKCHNIKSLRMNGNKVLDIYEKTKEIVTLIKKTQRPFCLQLDTFRFIEHCGPNNDDLLNYRDKKEIDKWSKRDPILLFKNHLKKKKVFDQKIFNEFERKLNFKINKAFAYALKEDFPEISSINNHVYAKNE